MSEKASAPQKQYVRISPMFTKGVDPFTTVKWVRKDAVITAADGREIFRQNDVEVPESWPDNTINIVAEKYFRIVKGVKEHSAKQMFHRVAFFLTINGIKQGLLEGKVEDLAPGASGELIEGANFTGSQALNFYNEMVYMFLHGMHAFNSPVWFNVGSEKAPQCSACFIQSVEDTMSDIMDLAKKEVMLFKGGSGSGSNLSSLRSSYEKLSTGGNASGPVSYMKGLDSFAGVTKSGGKTRRAAKMVVLNGDHPDILEQQNGEPGFITCKSHAEKVAHDLHSTGQYTAEFNKPGNVYDLVQFQNANNSVRVTDDQMRAIEQDKEWVTRKVKTGEVLHTYRAKDVFREIAKAAWECGDPGMQFDTSTNDMHTCKESGRINASNPCSEYLYLDDTACNLSSLNLLKFAKAKSFETDKFVHACMLSILAKEIIVDASSYPSPKIAEMSHKHRTLGLGFTNLGALLTFWGLPYDSNEGRAVAGAITAVMGGAAYLMSSDMARVVGPFPEYEKNKSSMLAVIQKHWNAAKRMPTSIVGNWQGLTDKAYELWRDAYEGGKTWGYRNAQTTLIAPTGTISFLMACDTTGIEPMLGIVTHKKAVGGGQLIIPNNVVEPALYNLGYKEEQVVSILEHIKKTGSIHTAPDFNPKHSPVFAEALGDYAISPEGHVDMMIACQPFLSGGISKTVNMPANCTVEDIEKVFMRAWKGGLKCIALYRDGCKMSQPISTKVTDTASEKKLSWGFHKKLPETREAQNHKFQIQGHAGYLTVGFYEDGSVGEVFVRMAKQGSTLSGLMDAWSIAISMALQHGTPVKTLSEKFTDMRFDPSGFTSNDEIKFARSVPDYIFRFLEANYGDGKPTAISKPLVEDLAPSPVASVQLTGPPCGKCEALTRRSGSCYVCPECGTTTGCS